MTGSPPPAPGRATAWLTMLALTACTGTGAKSPEGVLRTYVWNCTDGQTLVMRNLLPDRAITLGLADGEHRLDQTVSASGVRYADAGEGIVFWTKGDSAMFARAGSAAVSCTSTAPNP